MLKIVAEVGYSIGDGEINCKKKASANNEIRGGLKAFPPRGSLYQCRCYFYRFVYPINFSSTTAAVSRPSRSAHTTRL